LHGTLNRILPLFLLWSMPLAHSQPRPTSSVYETAIYSAKALADELVMLPRIDQAVALIDRQTVYIGIHLVVGKLGAPQLLPAQATAIARKVQELAGPISRIYVTTQTTERQFLTSYALALQQRLPLNDRYERLQILRSHLRVLQ